MQFRCGARCVCLSSQYCALVTALPCPALPANCAASRHAACPCRFEDADFMGELHKPEDKREVVCEELMREEAVAVWRKYVALPDVVHY